MSLRSPPAAGFDIHARLAPAPGSADRHKLRAEGVSPVLRVLVENVWDRRPVVLWGEEPEEAPALWKLLAGVRVRQDWEDWLAFARQCAWGKPVAWSKQVEDYGLEEKHQAWRRARQLLGAPLADWLQEDQGWLSWWSAAKARLDGDDDRLEKRTRDLDSKRIKSRPDPSGPWPAAEACTREAIREKAQSLAHRFGLRRIEAAAGMPLWCVAEHLAQAEAGLGDFAQAIGWPEERLGAQHLGLGWELGPKDVAAAYDPLQHMIYLGREDWHGSFAHEFGHAIDRVAADSSRHGRKLGMYLSTQLESDLLHEDIAFTQADLVHARQEIIRGFGAMYSQWREEGPASHSQLDPLDEAINDWMESVLDPSRWNPQQRHIWDRWRSRMTLVLTNAPKNWSARFSHLCDMAEKLWNDPPMGEGWRAWAQVRDEVRGQRYWSEPHELWARAYHALVHDALGQPGWAASDASASHTYPCRNELGRWRLRMEQRRARIENAWIEKSPALAQKTAIGAP